MLIVTMLIVTMLIVTILMMMQKQYVIQTLYHLQILVVLLTM